MTELLEAPGKNFGRVLVVDDSMITTESLRQALQDSFIVESADSGEACLEKLAGDTARPDLILLDIEMGGIDGLETCQRLRQQHDMPVIFVSSHDDLAERIKAFDSGGDDFVVKPFDPEVVLRKAQRIVGEHAAKKTLTAEKQSLQSMAMGFLRNIGDTGVLLTFMRSSLGVVDFEQLAARLLEAAAEYGIDCHVQLRHAGGSYTLTPAGKASPLEESVLEKSASMGRIFQFSRRLVVNYEFVSILILDLPVDELEAGKLRDNIAILAESAEAIAETIAMRKESAIRAEALQAGAYETAQTVEGLREIYRKQQYDARLRLEETIDNVEKGYFNLGLTDRQEHQISSILREGAENTLQLFDISEEVEKHFVQILDVLQPKGASGQQTDVWL
jgi:DNA-binding response OmpR family regulator